MSDHKAVPERSKPVPLKVPPAQAAKKKKLLSSDVYPPTVIHSRSKTAGVISRHEYVLGEVLGKVRAHPLWLVLRVWRPFFFVEMLPLSLIPSGSICQVLRCEGEAKRYILCCKDYVERAFQNGTEAREGAPTFSSLPILLKLTTS